MTRLAVVSDSHLSAANPEADRNWAAVLRHLEATSPDLVIHGGDISANGTDVGADLLHARDQLDRLPVPWVVVPGNHDLGDADPAWELTEQRRSRYEDVFGDRFWSRELDGWSLLGLDSQALVSGHPDDERWWQWTADQLSGERPTIVVLHRPVAPTGDTEIDTDRRYVFEPHRRRLVDLMTSAGVAAVITGHTHQWRSEQVTGMRWIWAPSTWAIMPDAYQPVIGTKEVGLVEFELDAVDQARLVVADGMDRNVVEISAEAAHR